MLDDLMKALGLSGNPSGTINFDSIDKPNLPVPRPTDVPVDPNLPIHRPTGLPVDPKKPNWNFYVDKKSFGDLYKPQPKDLKPAIQAAKGLGGLVGASTHVEEVGVAETDQGYIDEKISRGELPEGYTGSTHLMSLGLSKNKPEATLSDLQQKKQELLDHQSKVVAMQDEITSSFTDGVKKPNMIGLNQALQNLNIPNELEKVSNELKDIDLLLGMNSGYKEVKVLTDIAANEKPPSLDPELDKEVQEAAKVVTDGVTDGQPPKTMLGLAGTMLGNIFSDPAVQQALVYYAGARLMGYSASGSGMAAGQVLKSGWEQQAVLDKEKRALSAAQAKSKSPDLSETVEMWDPATRSIVSGNMAPNGDFYPSDRNLQAGPSRALGYVTYKPSLHKTTAELNHDLVTYGNDAVTNTLKTLDKKDYPYADQANNLFIDGGAVAEVVSLVSEKFRGTGVDYGTPSFRQSIERTIRSTVKSVAKKGPDSEGVLVADLASQVEANFLKVNMFNEDKVPKFVLSKVIWDGDKISGIDEDYEVAPRHVTKLFINANNLTNQILNQADAAYPNNREAHRSKVTNQKTIANLSKIFKDTVMNDKDRLKHWQQQGDKVQSNAFMAWVSSGGSNTEQKYLGLNNPSVVRKVAQMYDASFK